MAEKKNSDLTASANAADWAERLAEANQRRVLLAADVDRVKSFVFETARLPEMRGASQLLDELNTKWVPELLKAKFGLSEDDIIYAAGGSLLALVSASDATKIKDQIEDMYLQQTWTCSITVTFFQVPLEGAGQEAAFDENTEWLEQIKAISQGEGKRLSDANKAKKREKTDLPSKDFGSFVRALSYDLRRRKAGKDAVPVFEVSPYTERCEFCQIRPAEKLWSRNAVDAGRPTCCVCEKKRQVGRKKRLYMKAYEDFLGREGKHTKYALSFRDFREEVRAANDMGAIAEAAQSNRIKNYVGILYADGNDVGRVLEELSTKEEYKKFSEELRDTIEHAVMEGLAESLDGPREGTNDERQKISYHPFEIISIGGDDVYLFAPPDVILELACRICQSVEDRFKTGRNITLSAGVLITHANSPAYFTRRIVEGLLKSAKRRAKDVASESPCQTAIDFLVTTTDTTASENIESYREAVYRSPRFPEQLLTERPYTLNEMKDLIEQARALKKSGFPMSQLYSLRRSVAEHPQPRATNYYYYQLARDEKKQQLARLHEWLKLRASSNDRRLPFYPSKANTEAEQLITPFVDLLEIYDFIREA